MTTHAPISASKLERIMLCPASYSMEKYLPDQTNDAALRGTAIHDLSQMLFTGQIFDGSMYDNEMIDIAINYVEYLKKVSVQADFMAVELNLTPALSKLHPDLGGTADAVYLIGNNLHVIDLKTGRVIVDAENNKQLMMYALGAYMALGGQSYNIKNFYLSIYQPYTEIKTIHVGLLEMEAFKNELLKIAELANDPLAPFNAGTKQCKYCKAKAVCPTLKDRVMKNVQIDFQTTNIDLGTMLDKAELAIQWGDAIQAKAKEVLNNGGEVNGWTLKAGRKLQKWNPEFEYSWPPEAMTLKSPAEMKKLKIAIPDGAIIESHAAASLTRIKE